VLSLIAGIVLTLTVLWETFETIILPRRVRRRFRLTRLYYRGTWKPWSRMVHRIRSKDRREALLSFYGPLSLIGLLGLWAASLVLGFALVHYGLGSHIRLAGEPPIFPLDVYVSGTTFFTLGLGDVVPTTWPARMVTVIEAGVGFGFLAIVIGYLPVLYQSFSRREVIISMLDARAGSPPTAAELLRRHMEDNQLEALDALLRDWEQWSAELLESHLSYPVLAYFRSQHDNQSWLAALTTILDACALAIAGMKGRSFNQARLTFAMARHTVVDLSQVFNTSPNFDCLNRLDASSLERLHATLRQAGWDVNDPEGERLAHLRQMYEPYVDALAQYLHMTLPPWVAASSHKDNWQTSAWDAHP
jgi:Ion channel